MAPEKVSLLPFLFSSLLKNFKTFFNCCVENEKFYAHSFSILVLCFCVLMSVYKTPSDHSAQPGVEHPALRGCSRSACALPFLLSCCCSQGCSCLCCSSSRAQQLLMCWALSLWHCHQQKALSLHSCPFMMGIPCCALL